MIKANILLIYFSKNAENQANISKGASIKLLITCKRSPIKLMAEYSLATMSSEGNAKT